MLPIQPCHLEPERPPSACLSRFLHRHDLAKPRRARTGCPCIERLLLGSDYPYWPPRGAAEFVREHLAQAEQAAVFEGSARRLLRLDPCRAGAETEGNGRLS